jgi:hypothetical protein
MGVFAVLIIGALVTLLALSGFEPGVVAGGVIGFVAALLLLIFNEFTTRRALKERARNAALGHVVGGFALRLVVLAVGFFTLALTGLANPASFALSFLAGVMLILGWQVYRVSREISTREARTA